MPMVTREIKVAVCDSCENDIPTNQVVRVRVSLLPDLEWKDRVLETSNPIKQATQMSEMGLAEVYLLHPECDLPPAALTTVTHNWRHTDQ